MELKKYVEPMVMKLIGEAEIGFIQEQKEWLLTNVTNLVVTYMNEAYNTGVAEVNKATKVEKERIFKIMDIYVSKYQHNAMLGTTFNIVNQIKKEASK